MNLQTFTAPTFQECLHKVKQSLGLNAVILHTRTYSKRLYLGIVKREFVEITAGIGISPPERRRADKVAAKGPATQTAIDQFRGVAERAGHRTPIYVGGTPGGTVMPSGGTAIAAPAPASPPGRKLLEEPIVDRILGQQVAKDVEDLKRLVTDLTRKVDRDNAPDVPEELFDFYLRMIQNDVAAELAVEILNTIKKQLRPEHLANAAFVKDKIAEQIEKLIPTAGPIVRTKSSGPHVVALIGPTGVGKTTTIAKLAAKLQLVDKRKVGLITIDTYRIAAIDQLRRYADILGSQLRVVNTADDLREAVKSMSDCEYVLIDTAGRSPRDAMKINELKNFLDAAMSDEIHLVLSSTASQDCCELAMEKFGEVNFDKVIFTKLDEAAHVGVVLNAVRKLNKSLSYITTGQDVPDDIEVGKGKDVARLILGDPL